MPSAIIADDERLMRDQLRLRLEQVWPELEILAEARNGTEAIALVEQHQPDFTFLDIRMPGKTGLEAAREIIGKTHVVFITAYDQHAVEAFEQGAVDYVLKPAEPERLKITVERLKARLSAPPTDMSSMLSQLAARIAPKPTYLQWIQASIGQELRLIAVQDVLFFQSDEKYTRVQTSRVEALIRKPVRDLAEELDPTLFWQIHRSTLVNVHAIEGVARDLRGRHLVLIKGQPDKLEVSRSFVHLFKQM
ncbi:MAG: response regulator transcription factor [Herminiimonas sp.]|nr:response regulator transcription factor [Herminiimonas sp.]